MMRIILDTNIYGLMVKEEDIQLLKNAISDNNFIIYGLDIIRKELRDIPKDVIYIDKNLRVYLLTLYDSIVKNHNIKLDEKIKGITKKYYNTYREIGGGRPFDEMENDFSIVACASIKEMDLVISNDKSTLIGELSLKAYKIVNDILNLNNPKFWDYQEFKKRLI